MVLMIRCPLTGLTCGKPIAIQEKTFFLSEADEPRDATDRRRKAIKEALGKKYQIRSALLEKQPIAFNCKICEMIQSCAYGIADITGQKPNVLLELGMMFALGKPTIILCKKGEEWLLQLPSNLNAIEVVPFEDYIDIIDDVRQIASSLPPSVTPLLPFEETEKVLQEFNPQLAKDIKKALDEHKITLVAEFEKVIKEAKLDTTVSEKERIQITPKLEERLAKLEESLKKYERLGFASDATTAFYRGNFYYDRQEYEAAIEQYDWAFTLNPHYTSALNNRGNTYHELERYDEAIADYNRAIELRPDYPEALNNRGNTYHELERYDEAIADYNRAIELRPDDPVKLKNRGTTYTKMERYDEALADFNRALELRPDFSGALYNLACFFSLTDRPDDAISNLVKAIRLGQKYLEMAKTDSDFDKIRNDPRFQNLIEED